MKTLSLPIYFQQVLNFFRYSGQTVKGVEVSILFLNPASLQNQYKVVCITFPLNFFQSNIFVGNKCFTSVIIYRIPPSSKNKIPKNKFLEDFSDLLESVTVISGNLLIVGDFNTHCENLSSPETTKFNQLLLDYNLKQQVTEATHDLGHILDYVISRKHDDFDENMFFD